jgi:DNA-binding transcriptional LysR family regulator
LAQPALSRQIKHIEEEIGAVLFDRDKRNVSLTEGGHFFRSEMERLIMHYESACRRTAQIHRGEAGEIRIGHAGSAMNAILPAILKALKGKYPDLHTTLAEVPNLHMIENLRHRVLDICFAPNIRPFDDIESSTVYEENFVLIFPENHPIDVHAPLDWQALTKERFMMPPTKLGMGYVDVLHQIFREQMGFVPETIHESAYAISVLRLVEAGMGLGISPKSMIKGWDIGIKTIELKDVPQKAQMQMLWLKERTQDFNLFFGVVAKVVGAWQNS